MFSQFKNFTRRFVMKISHKIGILFSFFTFSISASALADVNYQHIRNATAKINYAGATFLVDPYLAPKSSYAGFAGTVNHQVRNPMIEMKQSVSDVVKGVEAIVVTHTHEDHWDEAAQKLLPKDLPIFVQNGSDAKIIRSQGFKDVRVVGQNTVFKNVRLSKVGGQHGTDQMYGIPSLAELAGDAMGVVFQAKGEKNLYIVGDTIWNHHVDYALQRYKPAVIVMNTGFAMLENFKGSIIMGKEDVAKAYHAAPTAQIIAVHMDAVNHTTVTSDEMREYVKQKKLGKRVFVPAESQVLQF